MDNKIKNSVLNLKRNIEKNEMNNLIQFENSIIKINRNRSEKWTIFFYIIFLIFLPLGLLINEILTESDNLTIALIIICILTFIYYLRMQIIGDNTLEINLIEKYFETKNNYYFLNKIFKIRKIKFCEVSKSELIEKTIYHRHGAKSKWLRLTISNVKGKKYILTDFKIEYPENIIAKDVKKIIDSTIEKTKKIKKLPTTAVLVAQLKYIKICIQF